MDAVARPCIGEINSCMQSVCVQSVSRRTTHRCILGAFCLLFVKYIEVSSRATYDAAIYGVAWQPWPEPPVNTTYTWQYAAARTRVEDITFVVMASSVNQHRHVAQRRSWMRNVTNILAFSDEAGPYTMTLPELAGRTTWFDAQHRNLRGMQWIIASGRPPTRWYVLVDDDTWVHVPMLLVYLDGLGRVNGSVIAGYRYMDNFFNGGAGIVLSQQAFYRIGRALYSEPCVFHTDDHNDNVIENCAQELGHFTFVHSNLFSFYPERMRGLNDFIEQVTVHPVKDVGLMYALTAAVDSRVGVPVPQFSP